MKHYRGTDLWVKLLPNLKWITLRSDDNSKCFLINRSRRRIREKIKRGCRKDKTSKILGNLMIFMLNSLNRLSYRDERFKVSIRLISNNRKTIMITHLIGSNSNNNINIQKHLWMSLNMNNTNLIKVTLTATINQTISTLSVMPLSIKKLWNPCLQGPHS